MRLTIHDLDRSGTGIGRNEEGQVVFCEGVLPGEISLASPIPSTKPLRAMLDELVVTSPARQTPPCPFFGTCGGCDIQHLEYEASLEWKHKRAFDCLERIGGFPPSLLTETAVSTKALASPKRFGYRNHVRYSIAKSAAPGAEPEVGFLARQSHDIVDQEEVGCLIAGNIANQVRAVFREAIQTLQEELTPFPHSLQVRHSEATEEVLLIFHTAFGELSAGWTRLANYMKRELAIESSYEVVGILVRQEKRTGRSMKSELKTLLGRPYYFEQYGEFRCPVHAGAFFQVNTPQAASISQTISEWASHSPRTVWDIYGGTGTLGLGFAAQGADVTVVERTKSSQEYGQMQAELNDLGDRYTFLQGDASRVVPKLAQEEGRPDLVITDPPRQGLTRPVIDAITSTEVPQWIYVSCDPATLARDLKIIGEGGYKIQKWQVFDMFPWTGHVETVVLMSRV